MRGKNIQVWLNGMLVVDFTEPTPPLIPAGGETERFLSSGTFALQCHDPGSIVLFRSLRVRPLPESATKSAAAPVVDETFRQVINIGRSNLPLIDYHVHLGKGLSLDQAVSKSLRDGFQYGILASCGPKAAIRNDGDARKFLDRAKGRPVFLGMHVEGGDWATLFSRQTASQFDYVLFDSSAASSDNSSDVNKDVDKLIEKTVAALETEPIDIYANPLSLPPALSKDQERLWTEDRMQKIAATAAKNGVAIEINDRSKLPGAAFIRLAKAAGCKFAFGTDNSRAEDLRRSEYGLQMVQECKLAWQDFFVPGAFGPKAVERKPGSLRS